jgi:hypothetical protein
MCVHAAEMRYSTNAADRYIWQEFGSCSKQGVPPNHTWTMAVVHITHSVVLQALQSLAALLLACNAAWVAVPLV